MCRMRMPIHTHGHSRFHDRTYSADRRRLSPRRSVPTTTFPKTPPMLVHLLDQYPHMLIPCLSLSLPFALALSISPSDLLVDCQHMGFTLKCHLYTHMSLFPFKLVQTTITYEKHTGVHQWASPCTRGCTSTYNGMYNIVETCVVWLHANHLRKPPRKRRTGQNLCA